MRAIVFGMALMALVSCGAGGEPLRPTASGSVRIGTDGIRTSSVVGVTNGTVSAGVGF